MSILYDEGQKAIFVESQRVLEARASKDRLLGLLDKTGSYDTVFWDTAVEQGWTALAIAEAHGGLGLGLTELGLVAQAAGAATSGAPFLAGGYGVATALAASGNAALQALWLPRLASGEAKAAIAFSEATSPLPVSPVTVFSRDGLTGAKPGVTGGLRADIALVWAVQDGMPVLALTELEGVERRPVQSFDNSRLFADISFREAPATVVARGPDAYLLARDILARMAVVTAHEQVGGAEALLFIARDYAITRKAFGQPIGAFQSVKHRLAEIYGLVEIARANSIHAAARVEEPDFLLAAADARLSATEAYDVAARDAVQIHGGIGATWEAGLHLHMRRARSLAMEQGNMLFWEDLLIEQLTGVAA